MAGFFSKKAKYSTLAPQAVAGPKKKDIPQGVWDKCKSCHKTVFVKNREENLEICPSCGYHYPMTADKRIELMTDKGTFKEIDATMASDDPLNFPVYQDKLKTAKAKTELKSGVVCGTAKLEGKEYALGVMDFRFIGGSLGSVEGEKLTRLAELATKKGIPLVIVTASGGARMYEGIMSLMQMAKTSGALQRHSDAGLSFITLLTNPTFGGVTASYASLGDINLAEPGALIGFAGPRVIKDTTQMELPEGFQTAEFLLEKGLVDRVVERENLRHELALCLEYFSFNGKVQKNKKSK